MTNIQAPVMTVRLPPTNSLDQSVPDPSHVIYNPSFYILGVFLVLNRTWVKEQYDQYIEISNESKFASTQPPEAAATHRRPTPRRFFWLQPHITSRQRQLCAVAVCGLVIPLILLELKWLYTLSWELSQVAVQKGCCADDEAIRDLAYWHRLAWCTPTTLALALLWIWLIWLGVLFFFTQLTYVLQLKSMRPECPLDLSHKWNVTNVAPGREN